MCGIAGFFHSQEAMLENSHEALKRMGKVLAHRGPDDYGEYLSGNCSFVFRRLSIIDLEQGHQPMFSPSKNTVIVFNGEIYNFRELRKELEGVGVQFKTNSDTEVILIGYEIWGEDVVHKLRGIFAFSLYDIENNKLFIARDHTGIKPFYYTFQSGYFVFASEIKAILEFPGFAKNLNIQAIPKYMSFLWVPAPQTLFENIFILEPGYIMLVDEEGIEKKRYWEPQLTAQDSMVSEREWTELIDSELKRVIKEQMISDVPLGAFLSGGVDSSTIVHYMNQISGSPITTYTTGFHIEDLANDVILSDLEYARLAARTLNVEYNEIILSPDVANLLPSLVWHMDEPVADPAAITTYLICKAAKEKCSVMLSGVGGDEIFGGYPRYIANLLAEKYQRIPFFIREKLIKAGVIKMPAGSSAFIRNAKKFLKSADMPFEERYFGYLTYYSKEELEKLLRIPFDWSEIFEGHRQLLEKCRCEDKIQSMMNIDLMTFLPNLNLMYTDKMSSAVAVEVRVPYLDHFLIENVARIPGSYKIRHGKRKYILKKVAEMYLPKKIICRKKAGFGAPVGAWLKGQLNEMMLDLLSEETVKRRGYFNYPFIAELIKNHLNNREYNANQLWQLMVFELWLQIFVDRPSATMSYDKINSIKLY